MRDRKGRDMVRYIIAVCALVGLLVVGFVLPRGAFSTDKVPRMTKEQLLPLMNNPGVIILDARVAREWKESPTKIKGAIRIDARENLKTLLDTLPRDKTLVFYCD